MLTFIFLFSVRSNCIFLKLLMDSYLLFGAKSTVWYYEFFFFPLWTGIVRIQKSKERSYFMIKVLSCLIIAFASTTLGLSQDSRMFRLSWMSMALISTTCDWVSTLYLLCSTASVDFSLYALLSLFTFTFFLNVFICFLFPSSRSVKSTCTSCYDSDFSSNTVMILSYLKIAFNCN